MTAPVVAICAALRVEARAVRSARPLRRDGGPAVRVVRVGMRGHRLRPQHRWGRTPAPRVALVPGERVLLAGFGGGLDPTLRPGDVVVASEIRLPGDVAIPCRGSGALVDALRAAGIDAVEGPLVCSDHVVRGAERARLAASGAIAVDMESGPVARAAARLAAPGAAVLDVVRVIVDTPDRGLLRASAIDGVRAYRRLRAAVHALIGSAPPGMSEARPGMPDTVETSTSADAGASSPGARPASTTAAPRRPSKVGSVQEGG